MRKKKYSYNSHTILLPSLINEHNSFLREQTIVSMMSDLLATTSHEHIIVAIVSILVQAKTYPTVLMSMTLSRVMTSTFGE